MNDQLRSWAEVSLDRIAANFRNIRAVVGPRTAVACVVKSEAYGHGMVAVAKRLVAEGAPWLTVTSTQEGMELRQAGIQDTHVLVMADALRANFASMLDYRLTPAVHDLADLAVFNELALARGGRVRVHLKVDSGMGRLGVAADARAIAEAVRACPNVEIEGLMSHLASSSDFPGTQTGQQVQTFTRVARELAGAGIRPSLRHISASGGVVYGLRDAWLDMVRVGLSLYGYVPSASGPAPASLIDVKPALVWKTRVLSVKELPAGVPVGYGARHITERPARIAVVGAGYADGVFRQLSCRGLVCAAGVWVPMLGAVSMDMCTIDVTDIAGVKQGDEVELLGEGFNADNIAALAGTISYDVLCKIQPRSERIYV
jgi:alanine racemase